MKRRQIITMVVVAMLMAVLTACGTTKSVTEETPTETAVTTETSPVGLKVPDDVSGEELLLAYIAERNEREAKIEETRDEEGRNTINFLTEEECDFLSKLGYNTPDTVERSIISKNTWYSTDMCYYPILFLNDSGEHFIMYVDQYGDAHSTNPQYGGSSFYFVHTDGKHLDNFSQITSSPYEAVYYNQETGAIQYWEYSNLKQELTVPKGSIYAGFSSWVGDIFRDTNGDVYALSGANEKKINCIAHNVQMVIQSDYAYSSDAYSNPLFLMNDGSLKAYVDWEGTDPDNPEHLMEITNEGGYHGTHYPLVKK